MELTTREARTLAKEWLAMHNVTGARIVSARTIDLTDLARASYVSVKVTGVPREQWAEVFAPQPNDPRGYRLANADSPFG